MEMRVWDDTKGTGRCRSCDAPITWFELVVGGKRHPFDGEPVYVRTYTDEDTRRLVGVIDAGHINRSHFATCPQAKQWRRPR